MSKVLYFQPPPLALACLPRRPDRSRQLRDWLQMQSDDRPATQRADSTPEQQQAARGEDAQRQSHHKTARRGGAVAVEGAPPPQPLSSWTKPHTCAGTEQHQAQQWIDQPTAPAPAAAASNPQQPAAPAAAPPPPAAAAIWGMPLPPGAPVWGALSQPAMRQQLQPQQQPQQQAQQQQPQQAEEEEGVDDYLLGLLGVQPASVPAAPASTVSGSAAALPNVPAAAIATGSLGAWSAHLAGSQPLPADAWHSQDDEDAELQAVLQASMADAKAATARAQQLGSGWQQPQGAARQWGTELALAGLRNETGDYNCFLNVIIQCLWRCADFRQQVGVRALPDVGVQPACANSARLLPTHKVARVPYTAKPAGGKLERRLLQRRRGCWQPACTVPAAAAAGGAAAQRRRQRRRCHAACRSHRLARDAGTPAWPAVPRG